MVQENAIIIAIVAVGGVIAFFVFLMTTSKPSNRLRNNVVKVENVAVALEGAEKKIDDPKAERRLTVLSENADSVAENAQEAGEESAGLGTVAKAVKKTTADAESFEKEAKKFMDRVTVDSKDTKEGRAAIAQTKQVVERARKLIKQTAEDVIGVQHQREEELGKLLHAIENIWESTEKIRDDYVKKKYAAGLKLDELEKYYTQKGGRRELPQEKDDKGKPIGVKKWAVYDWRGNKQYLEGHLKASTVIVGTLRDELLRLVGDIDKLLNDLVGVKRLSDEKDKKVQWEGTTKTLMPLIREFINKLQQAQLVLEG